MRCMAKAISWNQRSTLCTHTNSNVKWFFFFMPLWRSKWFLWKNWLVYDSNHIGFVCSRLDSVQTVRRRRRRCDTNERDCINLQWIQLICVFYKSVCCVDDLTRFHENFGATSRRSKSPLSRIESRQLIIRGSIAGSTFLLICSIFIWKRFKCGTIE